MQLNRIHIRTSFQVLATALHTVSLSERVRERDEEFIDQLASVDLLRLGLIVVTLRRDCQGLTLTPLLTPTVDTTYCNVVLIV